MILKKHLRKMINNLLKVKVTYLIYQFLNICDLAIKIKIKMK